MKDDHNIEKGLRGFDHQPDERVKKAVMSAFKSEFATAGIFNGPARFWRRPVPLYAAAVFVMVMMGLSYVAGRLSPNSGNESATIEKLMHDNSTVTEQDITWTVAERDLL